MKVPSIRNSAPVKLVRSLYNANRPMNYYKPEPQQPAYLRKNGNGFINWLKNLFKA